MTGNNGLIDLRMRRRSDEMLSELSEVNRVIMETSQKGCALIREGAPVGMVNVQVDFLRTLYRRRDGILHELKKAGITERDICAASGNAEKRM